MISPVELAAKGFSVFPLRPNSKLPAISKWQTKATRDAAQIEHWLAAHPDANWGIATGRFGEGEALVVVDIDTKGVKNGNAALLGLELEGCEFPSTLESSTASGGRHLIYRAPAPVKQGVDTLGPGLDIRSAGGFIVAPGSMIDGKPYSANEAETPAPAPQWLIDRCGAPRVKAADRTPLAGIDPERARARAIEYLAHQAPEAIEGAGGDATTFRVAAKLKDLGVVDPADACALMLEHWHDGCGWAPDDLAIKVRNAYRYGANPPGSDAPEAQFQPVETPAAEAKARYALETVDALLGKPIPPWLVRGILPKAGLGVIYGQPRSGKTFLVLDIAMAVAKGEPWAGKRVMQGNVLYIGLEGQVRTRIDAYKRHHSGDYSGFRALTGAGLSMLDSRDVKDLIDVLRTESFSPSLIVIDTLNRAMPGGDENSSTDMGAAIAQAGRLSRSFGCLVLFVHHSGKDASNGARGHSSLLGATDAELLVTAEASGSRRLKITKAKDAEDGLEFGFNLSVVDLGPAPDAPDERITSCVVTDLSPCSPTRGGKTLNWTPDRTLVHDAFVAALASAGAADFDSPAQCTTAQWRAAFFEQNPLGDDLRGTEAKAAAKVRQKKFERGKDWLLAQRLVRQLDSKDLYSPANN
jgi:hypothetical protein